MCFSAVECLIKREVVFVGSNVYVKSGRLKGSFPMYESMKCQNFNPEENHIVPNKNLFIFATLGETAISKIALNSKKVTAYSTLLLNLYSSTFQSGLLCSSTTKKNFILPSVARILNLYSQHSLCSLSAKFSHCIHRSFTS